jgi:hypothetical protein
MGSGSVVMIEQSSSPSADSDRTISAHNNVLSREDTDLLLRLARNQKGWWKDYSLLIAGLAFVLALITSLITAWTGYVKDIHDQQARLAEIIQNMQDLILKRPEVRQRYKDSPGDLPGILTLIAQQERSLRQDAVAIALHLGTNARTGELITLANVSLGVGNVLEAKQLLTLAVSASASALDKSFSLRALGTLQMHVIGSPEMRAAGNANFQRAVDLEREYPDIKETPELGLYIKTIAEIAWAAALTPTACNDAQLHVKQAQSYLSGAPVAVRSNVENRLSESRIPLSGGTIVAPPGCSPTSDQ